MLKITPDPPQDGTFVSTPINDLLQDRAAVGRALKHYLRDVPPPPASIETEEALVHALSLLRCASVSAAEASSHLDATPRDLVLSVQHLVDMAKTQVEKSLSGFTAR